MMHRGVRLIHGAGRNQMSLLAYVHDNDVVWNDNFTKDEDLKARWEIIVCTQSR